LRARSPQASHRRSVSEEVKVAASHICRPLVLRDINYQRLQIQKSKDSDASISRKIAIFQGLFFIVCLTSIIGLILLPSVFVFAKVNDNNSQVATGGSNVTANNMTSSTLTSPTINTTNTSTNVTNGSSTASVKSLVGDAIQEIENNDTGKALERMNLADQQLSTAGNTTSIQEVKVFIDDAIQLLQHNHDVNTAVARLKLADQQLRVQSVQTTSGNATKFLQYENSTYGIKMQYPSHWRVEGPSNSSIVASFYPQLNNAGYVTVQINNLTTNSTPDQYLNSLMLGDEADYKNFPDIRFNQNTTNSIVLAGHPGYLLNGTFRDPTSDALQRFTNIGTIIGDKEYSSG
jgi:hypothetical protein